MSRDRHYIPWNDDTSFQTYTNVVCVASEVAHHCPRFTADEVAEKMFRLIGWLYRIGGGK